MTQIKRSRRLQAGLAGLGVVGALGATVGLGLTTHTHSSQSGQAPTGGTPQVTSSNRSGESDDNQGSRPAKHQPTQQRSPVTAPKTTAPQATTSGS